MMAKNKSTLTVLLLIRNHEKFIQDCALSIIRELGRETPLVVVDTGSRDHSIPQLLDCLSDWLGGIDVIFSRGDLSTLENVHLGLNKIQSHHFILLSGDDALGEGYGKSICASLRLDEEHKTVYNFIQVLCDKDLKPIRRRVPNWSRRRETNLRLLSIGNPGTAPGSVIPTELLRDSLSSIYIPSTLIEDYWLWWKLVWVADFQNIDSGFVYYRKHAGSLSNSRFDEKYATSLGFSAALPINPMNDFLNQLFSISLIPRWIRHLDVRVWKYFFKGYVNGVRSQVTFKKKGSKSGNTPNGIV